MCSSDLMLKELRKSGETSVPMDGPERSYPVLRAFNLDENLFIPSFSLDLERVPGIYRVEYFTAEQPTWNSAAVVLAANALGGDGPTAGLFRGEGLPAGLAAEELIAAGEAIEAEQARHRP